VRKIALGKKRKKLAGEGSKKSGREEKFGGAKGKRNGKESGMPRGRIAYHQKAA